MEIDEYRKMYELEENFWWYRGMFRITQKILGRHFETNRATAILDAGCGTGMMLQALGQFSLRPPIGFDSSAEAVKFLKMRGGNPIFQASTTDIPIKDETFDLITSFDVLCQLPAGEDVRALREFYRLLKPNGKIYLRLPAYQWMFAAHDRFSLTHHRYTRKELIAKIKSARFRVLRVSYANFFLFPILAGKRMILENLGILANSSDLRSLPRIFNKLLEVPLQIESLVLKSTSLNFPWGLSLICLAEKTGQEMGVGR